MENVFLRGSTFYVVLNIPAAARHAFGGKAQVWKSLRTKDKIEARNRAVPILAALETQVKSACALVPAAHVVAAAPQRIIIQRDHALAAIERWRRSTVQRSYDEHWNDVAPAFVSFSDEAVALSDTRYKLSVYDFDGITSFYPTFSDALNSQGIGADAAHPVLPKMASQFADAWISVERHAERFRSGYFDHWPDEIEEGAVPPVAPAPVPAVRAKSGVKIMEAFDSWVAVTKPLEPESVRGNIARLIDFLGDPLMDDVSVSDFDRYFVELSNFPMTKKDVSKLSFREIVAKFERDEPGYKRLAPMTVWTSFRHFKQVWTFAHGRKLIADNPMLVAMPKKPKHEVKRKPYDAADILEMFSAPLFHGADRMLNAAGTRYGYCSEPGAVLVKDVHYWLPIFALWHGVRLEEIGAAKVADLVKHNGRWAFDWRDRHNMKNEASSRLLPIHQKLIDLGFIEYVQSQKADGFVFPELPHDPSDEEAATRQFSKWWGHWCKANAKTAGAGIDEPRVKVFHSLRHSFKRACRGKVDEEIHDLLTGHKGKGREGRGYGDGAEFDVLVAAIDKIDFPSFPTLPH